MIAPLEKIPAKTQLKSQDSMKLIALILAAVSALLLSSCNTMDGLGRDMQQAGNAMQRSAER